MHHDNKSDSTGFHLPTLGNLFKNSDSAYLCSWYIYSKQAKSKVRAGMIIHDSTVENTL